MSFAITKTEAVEFKKPPVVADPAPVAPSLDLPSTPSYEEAHRMIWGLGPVNWYKQHYDEQYQKAEWGHRVFDEGLHDSTRKEPGCYESAKAAYELVSSRELLMAPPSVKLYKDIHKTACRHFKGDSTCTSIGQSEIGEFTRLQGITCPGGNCCCLFMALADAGDIERDFDRATKYTEEEEQIEEYIKNPDQEPSDKHKVLFKGLSTQQIIDDYKTSKAWRDEFLITAQERLNALNAYIRERGQKLGLTDPIAFLHCTPTGELIMVYNRFSKERLEKAVADLFAEYNKNMASAKSKEEKLFFIADLFQMLDWLHPFEDGQGRVDLILLTKELCRHGFNPAILYNPFVSTFCSLEEWIEYLKDGMERWREVEAEERVALKDAIKA